MSDETQVPAHVQLVTTLAKNVFRKSADKGVDLTKVFPTPQDYIRFIVRTAIEELISSGMRPELAVAMVLGEENCTVVQIGVDAAKVDAVSSTRIVAMVIGGE